MNADFQNHITKLLKQSILSFKSVSGGDISNSYKIITSKNSYFIKINHSPTAHKMFQVEAYAIAELSR